MSHSLFRLLLGGMLIISLLAAPFLAAQAQTPVDDKGSSPLAYDPDAEAIDAALQNAIHSKNGEVLAFVINEIAIDHIVYNEDRSTALVWLAMIDPADGQVIAAEPGLAIADRLAENEWKITLQADKDWLARFEKLPEGLLPEEYRAYFDANAVEEQSTKAVFYGYKLPWGGGQAKRLSGSIGHFLIYHSCSETSCRYAYDFADGTMFPLLAARGGVVNMWKDSCANYDEDCSNYIVIKDSSTSPTTYQLYLHLANNTIPPELKSVGATVNQGQFIGNVDDTGYSTGHHLHFHVHTNAYSYWGNSVDIRFSDVDVNGGQPRTCNEAEHWPEYGTECHESGDWYVSGNELAKGPSGGLTQPTASVTTVTGRTVTVGGSGTDDRGVTKMQVLARTVDKDWFALGPAQTSNPFTTAIDLCAAGLPDGPITLSLQLWDVEGNTFISTNYRTIYKQHTCLPTPPACQPNDYQVALYTEANYTGSCKVFNGGSYLLDSTYNNHVRSLLVGSKVTATLYTGESYNDRRETWGSFDPNLEDNAIGMDTASSLRVISNTVAPVAPQIVTPHNVEGQALKSTDSVLFSWVGGQGALDYRAELQGPGGSSQVMDWLNTPTWAVGSLPAGAYTLTVSGRNPAGETASTLNFSISSASLAAGTTRSLPYVENFDAASSEWLATGLWNRARRTLDGRASYVWGFNDGTDYDSSGAHGGSLTSPPIQIPAGGAKMYFEYYVSIVDKQPLWDQRWLQISVNGGAFTNFYQFSNDNMQKWLISPLFDLSAYAGKTIRLRWYFHTGDIYLNNYAGWFIDNLNVLGNPPVNNCKETPTNDTIATATPISAYGRTGKLYICPSGDLDYYSFEASYGDMLNIWTEAKTLGSAVDGVLYLLDSDGTSVLAWNDDPATGVRDPRLTYQFTHDGTYYLLFKDYYHPSNGGSTYYYYMNIYLAKAPPEVTLTYPNTTWVGVTSMQMNALVNNPDGQTSKVEFYRHSKDWSVPTWTLLGSDTNGSNGWTLAYTPTVANDEGAAYYVRAYDRSGSIGGDVLWNVRVDSIPPVAYFAPLATITESTYVSTSWNGFDSGSGLAALELFYQLDGSAWQPWLPAIGLITRRVGYLGTPGQTVGFRLNALDMVGNIASPAAQTSTQIETACTPDAFEAADDDLQTNASLLAIGTLQEHNFCAAADEDWITFTALESGEYLVMVTSLTGGAAAHLEVYNSASEIIQSAAAADFGSSVALRLEVTASETYFLRIRPIDPNLMGSQASYQVYAGIGYYNHLPAILR